MPAVPTGIDLGTSTSAIGYWKSARGRPPEPRLIAGDLGLNYIRSGVLFDPESSTWRVGSAAWADRRRLSSYYIRSAKRHLGVDAELRMGDSPVVNEKGRLVTVTPQLILSKVLAALKQKLE